MLEAPEDAQVTSVDKKQRVAVIDIGSNSVRLVVYEGLGRQPIPIFNERVQCELGKGMDARGKLNPKGVKMATRSLARFAELTNAMKVERVLPFATAAVREARDGPVFLEDMKRRFGMDIRVLSGEEEAEFTAVGILSGEPDAEGLVGDLGGGSLELSLISKGRIKNAVTLPLGHLRLYEAGGGDAKKMRAIVRREIANIPWLEDAAGKDFHAVGGTWRAIAKILISQTNYPLHIIDNFTMSRPAAQRLLRVISGLGLDTLAKMPSLSRPARSIPGSVAALEVLLKKVKPERLVFSARGVREGVFHDSLPQNMKEEDPLIEGCVSLASQWGRFGIPSRKIFEWASPIFKDEDARQARLRLAATYLSDIAWYDHPDYRAEHAFYRVLRIALPGLEHDERVFLATALLYRYGGEAKSKSMRRLRALISKEDRQRARSLGYVLRLAYSLFGGDSALLAHTKLKVGQKKLTLELPEDIDVYASDTVESRMQSLAKSVGRTAKIESV